MRYSAYKISRPQWIGDIPENLEVIPLKYLARINRVTLGGDTPPDFEMEYIDIGSVDETGLIAPPVIWKFKDAPSRARRVVRKNDTIISTVRVYLKAIAFIEESKDNLIASTGFAVLTPRKEYHPKYLYYVLQGHAFINQVSAESKGVNYPAITPSELGRIKLAVTKSRSEQEVIVSFLDQKLAEIDRFIADKKRLIEMLKEQKTITINRVLTQGLDPEILMKPSGIEYLGEIPAHWEVKRSKYIFREINERSESGLGTHLSMSQKLGLVETERISEKTLQSETQEGFKVCQINDLVLNKLKAHLSVFAHATIPGLVSPDYSVFRLKVEANIQYFEMLYRHPAYVAAFNKAVRGIVVGFYRLYTPEFYNIRTLFPPKEEQDRIMSFIRDETSKIDQIISHTNHEIELIRELRTVLISDTVTGKIDVRAKAKEEI